MAAAILAIAQLAPTAEQVILTIIAHEQARKQNPALPSTASLVTAAQVLASIEATDAQIEANATVQSPVVS